MRAVRAAQSLLFTSRCPCLVIGSNKAIQWRIQGRGPTPLIFRPNWGPKGRKKIWGETVPPPPRYLKVWIRHCYETKLYDFQGPTIKFQARKMKCLNSMTFQVFYDLYEPCNKRECQPSSLIGACLTLPNLGFLWVFFKYPKISKNGNLLFFPVNKASSNFESATFSFRIRFPSTRIRWIRQMNPQFLKASLQSGDFWTRYESGIVSWSRHKLSRVALGRRMRQSKMQILCALRRMLSNQYSQRSPGY